MTVYTLDDDLRRYAEEMALYTLLQWETATEVAEKNKKKKLEDDEERRLGSLKDVDDDVHNPRGGTITPTTPRLREPGVVDFASDPVATVRAREGTEQRGAYFPTQEGPRTS